MMHMINIQIPAEHADALCKQVLQTSLNQLREDVSQLKHRTDLAPFEQEDLADFENLIQAFERVIKYYTNPHEWHLI